MAWVFLEASAASVRGSDFQSFEHRLRVPICIESKVGAS